MFCQRWFAKIYFDWRKRKHPEHLHTGVYKSLFGVLCPVLTENFKVSVWLLWTSGLSIYLFIPFKSYKCWVSISIRDCLYHQWFYSRFESNIFSFILYINSGYMCNTKWVGMFSNSSDWLPDTATRIKPKIY